ncbi:AI-2E family transporter [bacterium endosymbiont of Pedicinus badii]|uniref:AI-2E family transporter n=1 Tax=bacterium endosymbiont of Pedicinus badii TaxID=1719126 RepID=UPI0009BBA479|nr:AI-2E family transporter [bacterium endosymbiont of Pedicinus badii]OQM34076.1 hypothetical protein AOQ89_01830 [bacterium endosymbiont of Pedicinus badii]
MSIKNNIEIFSYFLIFTFLLLLIPLHLFPCFLAGSIMYEIIFSLTPYLEKFFGNYKSKFFIIIIISISIFGSVSIGLFSLVHFLTSEKQYEIDILKEANQIFLNLKNSLSKHFPYFLPNNTEELKEKLFFFLKSNISIIRKIGKNFLHGVMTVFIGIVIGSIISLNKPSKKKKTYFIKKICERISILSSAFRNIIFAQLQVSLINTFLTSIMILILFPIFGMNLFFKKTLILITFILGLLPIIGNLISNFIIIVSAISISFTAGFIMTIYLVLIHKLEYFLNAEIVGNRIQAKSWEILLAMLIFEAAFGIQGLVAAPIYYAYLKSELRKKKII